MKLHVVMQRDETGYYVAEVPALPGCLSQGRTLSEAKVNIREAIVGWLTVMDARARKRPAQTLLEVAV
ncbi:MAG: type II toxin-antitoxin system HicB family antitoxin [Candidatus Omnitrophica bacterium]|nr:type II toxin-antitoxin system HicB family antitoxin [Candidatus Omnitrophota bacterium]